MAIAKLSNGININYDFRQVSEKADTLVFLNGTFNVLNDWKELGDMLHNEKQCNVLTFEMRNQGDSTKVTEKFSYADILEDMELLFEHLNLHNFYLITYSSASTFAIDYIVNNPSKVKALILGAPVVNPLGAFKNQLLSKVTMTLLESIGFKEMFEMTYALMFSNNFCEQNKESFDMIQQGFEDNFKKENLLPFMKAWDENTMTYEKLNQVFNNVDTYYIYGEQDIFNPSEFVEDLYGKYEQLHLYKIENSGHGFHVENMERYNEILQEIISE